MIKSEIVIIDNDDDSNNSRSNDNNLMELVQLPHNRSCASLGAVMNCGERRGGSRL